MLFVEKERIFFYVGEVCQIVKLGGVLFSGSVVIFIEIKDIFLLLKVEIYDGKMWIIWQILVKLLRDDRFFVSIGEIKEVIMLDGFLFSGVVILV